MISFVRDCISLVLTLVVVLSTAHDDGGDINTNFFPREFLFGVGSSSYQIEGGWDADGKGESVWDHIVHTDPSFVSNNENGDVACDSYHKWEEDVKLLKHLLVKHYRFSLSWSRILPTGFANVTNPAGINYYKNLVKALKENNIEPVVTLHHLDFPQALQDIGGWINPSMADYFADYARVAFTELGDYVKYWATFNQPKQTCEDGYGDGDLPPAVRSPGVGEYVCARTVMLAHAKAYHIYDDEFRASQNGSVSIILNTAWSEPATESKEDAEAAERQLQFALGFYGHPIYNGNWPQVVIDRIQFRSAGENLTKSRLPEFTEEEIAYIKGTYDYFALNSFLTTVVEDEEEAEFGDPSFSKDQRIKRIEVADIPRDGERKLLNWVKDQFNDPKIFIAESGVSDDGIYLEDTTRITYMKGFLSGVLDAMFDDNVTVIGYTAYSFMDSFEWTSGYSRHYGLYHVNFTSEDLTRTPRKSVDFYRKAISLRSLIDYC